MSTSLFSNYVVVSKTADFFLLQHKATKQKAYYKEYFGTKLSKKEYDLVCENFMRRKSLNSQNLLEIHDYSISNYCESSTDYKFGLIYEYWVQNFQMELDSKMNTFYYWSEEELLNTIEGALQGLFSLHSNGITHGDIRSCNIVVNEEGFVKLADQFVTSNFYKKTMKQMLEEKNSLIAPETLIFSEDPHAVETPENDLWALGMIFLEASTLLDVSGLYNWSKKNFDFMGLDKKMEFIKEKYGKGKLYEVLNTLLHEQPFKRREVFHMFGLQICFDSVEKAMASLHHENEGKHQEDSPKFDLDKGKELPLDEEDEENNPNYIENHKNISNFNENNIKMEENFNSYNKSDLQPPKNSFLTAEIENFVNKQKTVKQDFIKYLKNEIKKREKSLERLKGLLKQAGEYEDADNSKISLSPCKSNQNNKNHSKTDNNQKIFEVTLKKSGMNITQENQNSTNFIEQEKSKKNNSPNKPKVNHDPLQELNNQIAGLARNNNSKHKKNGKNFDSNLTTNNNNMAQINSFAPSSLHSVISFQKIEDNSNIKPYSPQKVSSLSLIKDKYAQNNFFVSTLKSTDNKENEEDSKTKNFDDFSIIKNEEGVSFSENGQIDFNSNKALPLNEEKPFTNNHLNNLNRRLDECLSKGRSHSPSPSPSNRSYDQKNPGDISRRSKSLKESPQIQKDFISNSIKKAEKSAEKLKIKKIIYDNGEFYEGEVLGNLRHGYGTLYSKTNKVIYQGEWENDLFNGHGIRNNLNVMSGEFKEDFFYGDFNRLRGFWVKYEGGFLQGKKHGTGVLMLSNNEYFQGMFCEDKIHGKGTFQMNSGKRIIGEWNNNKMIHKIN